MATLDETLTEGELGHLAAHAELRTAYLARGTSRSLPVFDGADAGANGRYYGPTHDTIHATLHGEHNALGAATSLPTTIGSSGHLLQHAALATAHNLRQTQVFALDSSSGNRLGSAGTSLTWTHTPAGAVNYALVFIATNIQNNGTGTDYIENPSVTYGATPMVERTTRTVSTGGVGTNRALRVFHLVNPPAGQQVVTVTIPIETGATLACTFTAESVAFTGASSTQTATVARASTTAAATTISCTGAYDSAAIVVSAAAARASANLTPGSGMTLLHNRIGGTNIAAAYASQPGTVAASSASWATADQGAIVAVPVLPATSGGSTFAPAAMPTASTYTDPETGTVWPQTWQQDFLTAIPRGDVRWETTSPTSGRLVTTNPYAVDRTDNAGTAISVYEPTISTTSGLGHYDSKTTMWTENSMLRIKMHTAANSYSGVVEPLGAAMIPRISNTASPSDYWQKFIRAQFRYRVSDIVNPRAGQGESPHYGLVWQMINSPSWPEYGEYDFPEHESTETMGGFFHPSSILRLPSTPLPHGSAQDTSTQYRPATPVSAVNTWHTVTLQWEPRAGGNTSDSHGRLRWWIDDQLCMDRTQYVGDWAMNFMVQCGDNGFLPDAGTSVTLDIDWAKMWKHPQTVFGGP